MSKITAYARLLRIPGIGGLAIPPVIGAITVGVTDFFSLFIVFVIGALAALYGFILNDYADVEVDRLSKELSGRPLVSGEISKKTALFICVLFVIVTFGLIGFLYYDEAITNLRMGAFLCIIVAFILGSIYDFYGKKIVGSDFLVAVSMALVFLFGALSFGRPNVFTWVIFVLTFNNLLHMNAVEGGIKDSDHDPLIGVKNIASVMGVKVKEGSILIPNGFKVFSINIRLFSSFLLFAPFFIWNRSFEYWQIIILGLFTFGMLFFSLKLLSIKKFDRNLIRKYISIQSFLRYSLVPIMLISFIGLKFSLLLIVFPIVWYIVFTPLIGEKFLKPRM